MLSLPTAVNPLPIPLDTVSAYDRVAPFFSQISQRRQAYLRSTERLVVARVPQGGNSLLDIGAGDGVRAMTIAREAGLSEVVLLEPSKEMIKDVDGEAEIWPIRAEDLQPTKSISDFDKSRRFDVITCLWNAFGHIRGNEVHMGVLAQLSSMLTEKGRIIFDVNHRYNIKSYGLVRTAFRFLRDRVSPKPTNGDVKVTWRIGDEECRTYGHVFTDREVRRLASVAGLVILERIVVDYDTGEIRRFGFQGNLFYVLRRNSSNDSANASPTR